MTGKTVDAYIAGLEDWQAEIVSGVRQVLNEAAPDADEAIKWAQPVYSSNGPFAYIKAFKNSVNFGISKIRKVSCRAAGIKCAISNSPAQMISMLGLSLISSIRLCSSIKPKVIQPRVNRSQATQVPRKPDRSLDIRMQDFLLSCYNSLIHY